MEETHHRHGVAFYHQPKPVITDPNTVVRTLARQMLHIRQIVQQCTLLDLFKHSLDLLAQRFSANLLQVFGETPAKDNLHHLYSQELKNFVSTHDLGGFPLFNRLHQGNILQGFDHER